MEINLNLIIMEISDYLNNEDRLITDKSLDLINSEMIEFMCNFQEDNRWKLSRETNKVNSVLKHNEIEHITQENNLIKGISRIMTEEWD